MPRKARDAVKTWLIAAGIAALSAVGVVYEVGKDDKPTWQQSTEYCVMPNCWTLTDGGYDDNSVGVDCQFTGALGLADGGPRWRGCNTGPLSLAVGTECLPVDCDSNQAERDALDDLRDAYQDGGPKKWKRGEP